MVLVAAADQELTDPELRKIGEVITGLPAFADFDPASLGSVVATCADLLHADEGLDAVLGLVADALPDDLRETAYALACDVAAADGRLPSEEIRVLELIRHGLEIERLVAAGIERGARARYTSLS